MKLRILIIPLALASCEPQPPMAERPGPPPELTERVAGKPQNCVPIEQMESLRIAGNGHMVLYGSGRTIWANHLGQCRLNPDDILVTHPFGSSYCRGDIVRSVDRTSRIPGPTCVLSDFVPYTR